MSGHRTCLLAVLTPGVWSQVQVNRQVVALPYVKNEVHVYQSGINYVVEVSKLGALISYNGLSFSIRLPYHLFGNNTKGQCGEPPGPPLKRTARGRGEAGCERPARNPVGRGRWESCVVCALGPGLRSPGDLGWRRGGRGLVLVRRGLPPDTGTCTNNTADDCVLPSGEVVSNCESAADQWVVNDPSKPHCPHTSTTTKPPASTPPGGSTTTHKGCASPLCELIKDRCPRPSLGNLGSRGAASSPCRTPVAKGSRGRGLSTGLGCQREVRAPVGRC